MYCIAISAKGYEYMYKRESAIKCSSKKQAIVLRDFLNKHNDTATNNFKCKDNQIWHIYEDIEPYYKIKNTKGKIIVTTI